MLNWRSMEAAISDCESNVLAPGLATAEPPVPALLSALNASRTDGLSGGLAWDSDEKSTPWKNSCLFITPYPPSVWLSTPSRFRGSGTSRQSQSFLAAGGKSYLFASGAYLRIRERGREDAVLGQLFAL